MLCLDHQLDNESFYGSCWWLRKLMLKPQILYFQVWMKQPSLTFLPREPMLSASRSRQHICRRPERCENGELRRSFAHVYVELDSEAQFLALFVLNLLTHYHRDWNRSICFLGCNWMTFSKFGSNTDQLTAMFFRGHVLCWRQAINLSKISIKISVGETKNLFW